MNQTPEGVNLLSRRFWWSNGRYKSDGRFGSATAILVYLSLVKLVIHLLTANNYGYFGDELYWLAMTKHLDFGYVDVPPLVAYIGAGWRFIFGTSLFAIHILPALAGAVMVFFAGLLARELGGGRFAQGLTAVMVLVAPFWLVVNSMFAYDPFDQLCTVLLLYCFIRLFKQETPSPRRWLGLGLIAGLGVMTKLSMIFMLGALMLALLISSGLKSPWRKSFLTVWPWLAAVLAVLICTPYLAWQWAHKWPLLTYWRHYALYRPHLVPLQFFGQLLNYLNPFLAPLWLLGLGYLLFHPKGRFYWVLGFIFLILLIFYMGILKTDSRLLVSACLPLLAAGAVWLEQMATFPVEKQKGFGWIRPISVGIILISGLLLAPFTLPLLPIATVDKIFSGVPFAKETIGTFSNRLPMNIAFRLGWPEMVKEIAAIYHRLPEAEQKKCLIWVRNYAEAGAIDLLGPEYGLPPAICNHLSYQFWGPGPAAADFKVMIMIGIVPDMIFDETTRVTYLEGHPYAVSWEKHLPVFICRKPTIPLKKVWPNYAFFY